MKMFLMLVAAFAAASLYANTQKVGGYTWMYQISCGAAENMV